MKMNNLIDRIERDVRIIEDYLNGHLILNDMINSFINNFANNIVFFLK